MVEKEIANKIKNLISVIDQVDICIKSRITDLFNELKLGINSDQYVILEAIYNNNGLYQRELSKTILKERSMIARTLNRFERLGFVEILVGTRQNRLVKNVFITQEGKNIIETNQQNLKYIFLEFLSSVPDEDLAKFIHLLEALKYSLKTNE